MQCGLAFSKAGQCRIASLRKELHHKEKRTGEEESEGLRLREGYWRGRLAAAAGVISYFNFFYYYIETRAGCL